LTAFAANLGHVLTIPADNFAALAACLAGFLCIPFVRGTLFVSRFASLAGDCTLFVFIHGGETAIAGASLFFCMWHAHSSPVILNTD
jgi:hypothetical protein